VNLLLATFSTALADSIALMRQTGALETHSNGTTVAGTASLALNHLNARAS
jgi:hypothetical protein